MATQNSAELLAQLRGIQMPEAPAEPAVWPVILSIGILVLLFTVFVFNRTRRPITWAKQAKQELNTIESNESNDENNNALGQTALLLKRIVITHDKSNEVKRLSGDRWLMYLDSFFETRYFSEGNGQLFGSAQYQQAHQMPPEMFNELKILIQRKHRSQQQ